MSIVGGLWREYGIDLVYSRVDARVALYQGVLRSGQRVKSEAIYPLLEFSNEYGRGIIVSSCAKLQLLVTKLLLVQ